MNYIGIDPGLSGGIARIDKGMVFAQAMPKTERDVFAAIAELVKPGETVAVIEAVHTMPGQGIASAGVFLQHYGGLRMALVALGIPFLEVTPGKWQKALNCLAPASTKPRSTMTAAERSAFKREHKQMLKALAQQMCPAIPLTLATADAVLLATYCARQDWRGTIPVANSVA